MYEPHYGEFQLSLPGFEGQLRDLVRLVANRRLAIADVSLTQVTEQLQAHVAGDACDLDETGELLSESSRLLLLISSRLLAQPVTDSIDDEDVAAEAPWMERERLEELTGRLRAREGLESIVPLLPAITLERRHRPHSPQMLSRLWAEMRERQDRTASAVSLPSFARLEVAVSALIRRLKASVTLSFRSLLRGAGRDEAVVHFLAVLELVRRRQVQTVQERPFEDIALEYIERAVESASRAG